MSRKKQHYKIDNLVDTIRCIIDDNDIEIIDEKTIDYGYQLKTNIGGVINVYVTGKIYVCGEYDATIRIKKHLADLDIYKWLD